MLCHIYGWDVHKCDVFGVVLCLLVRVGMFMEKSPRYLISPILSKNLILPFYYLRLFNIFFLNTEYNGALMHSIFAVVSMTVKLSLTVRCL